MWWAGADLGFSRGGGGGAADFFKKCSKILTTFFLGRPNCLSELCLGQIFCAVVKIKKKTAQKKPFLGNFLKILTKKKSRFFGAAPPEN